MSRNYITYRPYRPYHDYKGEIALCILSAINVGIVKEDEMESLCDLSVRGLEELIDYQEYPVEIQKRSTIARRSLGIGYIGLAHYLAKNKVKYDDPRIIRTGTRFNRRFQYYLLCALYIAEEKGM